jgi:hypothetical protein
MFESVRRSQWCSSDAELWVRLPSRSSKTDKDDKQRQAHHKKYTNQPKEQYIQAAGMSNLLGNDNYVLT